MKSDTTPFVLLILSLLVSVEAILSYEHFLVDKMDYKNPYYIGAFFEVALVMLGTGFVLLLMKIWRKNLFHIFLLLFYPIVLVTIFEQMIWYKRAWLFGGGTWTNKEILLGWIVFEKAAYIPISVAFISQIVFFILFKIHQRCKR